MLTGTITLVSEDVITITDAIVVSKSVMISMSTCGKKTFTFGTFNAAMLKMAIVDDDALDHEFAGAKVELAETVTVEGQPVTTDLGTYWIDGASIKRQKNMVSFRAQDATAQFNVDIDDSDRETEFTPATLYAAACTAAGVSLDSDVDPSDFPNDDITFTLKSIAIQTWRDAVMWCAQLQACNAIIDREGKLTIRPARPLTAAEDDDIDASERTSIQFSDTRIYIKYMDAYSAGKLKTYITPREIVDDQARKGKISLPYNPLLEDMEETDCDTINAAILSFMSSLLQRQITAELFSNSQVALGHVIRFRGGKIDVRRSVLAEVTAIDWRYHGHTTVTCTAPEAITEEGGA